MDSKKRIQSKKNKPNRIFKEKTKRSLQNENYEKSSPIGCFLEKESKGRARKG